MPMAASWENSSLVAQHQLCVGKLIDVVNAEQCANLGSSMHTFAHTAVAYIELNGQKESLIQIESIVLPT